MFDIEALSTTTEATYDLELVHPAHGPTGLFIRHLSSSAPTVEALARKQGNAMLRKSYAAQRKGKDGDTPTIEEGTGRSAELLAAATVKWFEKAKDGKEIEGWPKGDGRLKFTTEEAVKLYSDPGYRWARELLDESVADIARFLAR